MKLANIILMALFLAGSSCSGFLEEKPEKALVIPDSLDDYQALLDAEPRLLNSIPKMGFLASDEIEIASPLVSQLTLEERSAYIWEGDFYSPDGSGTDWIVGYQRIFYANIVIDGLKEFRPITPQEQQRAVELDAAARFYRAFGHFLIAGQFMDAYNPTTPEAPGIPIRETADLNAPSPLVTMKEAMDFIRNDLEIARTNLPQFPEIPTRASAWAAEALLSRVSLYMQDYEAAFFHASNALSIRSELFDYNKIDPALRFVFPRFNVEVIHHAHMITGRFYTSNQTYLADDLVDLYDSTDLRFTKVLVPSPISGRYNLQGRYTGEAFLFGGLATDEVVLDRAEAAARIGNETQALTDLNYLLINRYKEGAFIPVEGLSGKDLIRKISEERRKELLYRGVRWLDMKRYNQDPDLAKTVEREWSGQNYVLEPNSGKYKFPIPPRELRLNDML